VRSGGQHLNVDKYSKNGKEYGDGKINLLGGERANATLSVDLFQQRPKEKLL
jgi:hypothetical protein